MGEGGSEGRTERASPNAISSEHRRPDGSLLPGHPGAWKPGQSGNPAGRPSAEREVTKAARSLALEGLQELANVMRDKKAQAIARVRAVEIIMERAYGKAPQKVVVEGDVAGMENPALQAFLAQQLQEAAEQARSTIEGEAEPIG